MMMVLIITGQIVCSNPDVLSYYTYFISYMITRIVYWKIEQSCSSYHLYTDHSHSPYKVMYEIYASPMILYNYKLCLLPSETF